MSMKYHLVFIVLSFISVVYWLVIIYSGCDFQDGPFTFVRGCYNYGIDWNKFMAPIGMVVLWTTMASIGYWLYLPLKLATMLFRKK